MLECVAPSCRWRSFWWTTAAPTARATCCSAWRKTQDCRVILHDINQGKGAAVKSGLAAAQGNVVVIQDADMEYDPRDLRLLLQPIVENEADVVYGSRFIHNDRPVSPLWHQGANQLITFCAVLASGYRFTDVETCYKMFRRELLQDIVPTLREKRFGIEIELTFKLVKQPGVRFFERPIRYARRSYAEGKKIGWRDGFAAPGVFCGMRFLAEPIFRGSLPECAPFPVHAYQRPAPKEA